LRRERNFSDMLEVEEEPLESKWWGGLGGWRETKGGRWGKGEACLVSGGNGGEGKRLDSWWGEGEEEEGVEDEEERCWRRRRNRIMAVVRRRRAKRGMSVARSMVWVGGAEEVLDSEREVFGRVLKLVWEGPGVGVARLGIGVTWFVVDEDGAAGEGKSSTKGEGTAWV
jgi:hypothetical protein